MKLENLEVETYQDGRFWYVKNEELNIIGTGDSQEEAKNDFYSLIIHFHDYYKRLSADKVTGEASRLKNIFETINIDGSQEY